VTALGTLRILEAVRRSGVRARIYQASSSEMYGSTPPPQSERSLFHPRSPYACAKVFAHNITINYRETYGIFATCGIVFNHESPRRGENFVTRKITRAVARINAGLQEKLYLGNLEARRDWGYAPEYVEAMWLMMQQSEPDDFVLATGTSHSVRDFAEAAFAVVGRDWRDHVEIDPRYLRPAEVDSLIGDAAHARAKLGWEAGTHMLELARIMVEADIAQLARHD
jgi:GDPmannose 4,6-dehydratase